MRGIGNSLGGQDVSLGLVGSEGVGRKGSQREQSRGESRGGLHCGEWGLFPSSN